MIRRFVAGMDHGQRLFHINPLTQLTKVAEADAVIDGITGAATTAAQPHHRHADGTGIHLLDIAAAPSQYRTHQLGMG